MDSSKSLKLHKKLKGKISVKAKMQIKSLKDLSLLYTPGVADASLAIKENPSMVYDLTMKSNCVAIITDGSRVLGLGNIGALASLPVMEGKAMLFNVLAGIDAFPIPLLTQDKDEIISIVKNISPVFGGINLEDIENPKCFEIERELQEIGIPVFHDDQHGTAIAVLAGLLNSLKVVGKDFKDTKIVVNGAGAAGQAVSKLLLAFKDKKGNKLNDLIVLDRKGIISKSRTDFDEFKQELAKISNKNNLQGDLATAIKGADVFIGLSSPNVLKKEMIQSMNKKPIIFALSNPFPEIWPKDALSGGAKIVATARSDFPNQLNNSLVFPGIFRGALDAKAAKINNEMKIAAALALASCIKNPSAKKILPEGIDKSIVPIIAKAVKLAAISSGVVRK